MIENQLKYNNDKKEAFFLFFPSVSSSLNCAAISVSDSTTCSSHFFFFFLSLLGTLDSCLTQNCLCNKQTKKTPYRFVKSRNLSSNVLVQSANVKPRTQRKLLPSISSHSLLTATVSSWTYPILSINLSREFKTLQQDNSSWQPVTATLHLSCKNCTGFPFQSALNTKLHADAFLL